MATHVAPVAERGHLGATQRRDSWWAGPLATGLGLGAFIVYATFRVFHNRYYQLPWPPIEIANAPPADVSALISPFYSPLIVCHPADLDFAGIAHPLGPGGFRVTCYYYRKAYYRPSFSIRPPAPWASRRGHSYRGETRLLFFQKSHRYFLYFALVFLVLLTIDVSVRCLPARLERFGISVGDAGAGGQRHAADAVHASCHSLRHLVGGNIDCFSCVAFGQARYQAWTGRQRPEQAPHAVGLGQPVLGGLRRLLRLDGGVGHDCGHADSSEHGQV